MVGGRRYSNLPLVGFHMIYSSVLQLILDFNLKLKEVLLSFSSVYCMLVSTYLKMLGTASFGSPTRITLTNTLFTARRGPGSGTEGTN